MLDALEVPGGGRRLNELLAFFQIEEEDRQKRQQKDDVQRAVEMAASRPRSSGPRLFPRPQPPTPRSPG